MFKVFKLNNDYKFDYNGNFTYKDKLVENTDKQSKIDIWIQNTKYSFSRVWLGLICHFEVSLPVEQLIKIKFINCNSKVLNLKCGMLMTFTSKIPVIENAVTKKNFDNFFVIPGFPNFSINRYGVVKSINTSRVLKSSIGPYGYPYVNVYDPDKNNWRSVSVHILLARVFIPNKFPDIKIFVNHKDGDKLNMNLSNLEWVTSEENQNHAIENGLRSDNLKCKMLDIVSGEVKIFPSLTKAFHSLGYKRKIKPITIEVQGRILPVLFRERFEIRYFDDCLPWFHNGNVDIDTFCKDLKTYIENRKRKAITDNTRKYYLLKNLKDGSILNFSSKRQACKFLGIDKRTFNNRIKKSSPYRDWEICQI